MWKYHSLGVIVGLPHPPVVWKEELGIRNVERGSEAVWGVCDEQGSSAKLERGAHENTEVEDQLV